jgi:hypothetical protein
LRICIIANEVPFPPTHGGQVDVWRRIEGLLRAGVKVCLIAWAYSDEFAEKRNASLPAGLTLELIERRSGFFGLMLRLLLAIKFPSQVAARVVFARQYEKLRAEVGMFSPDLVMVDGLFSAPVGIRLSADLDVPLVARSHNIEHKYIRLQFERAATVREKVALWLAGAHLKEFEHDFLRRVDMVYDISYSDAEFWRGNGLSKVEWLPPVSDARAWSANQEANYDVGFLGNLYAPNNVNGLVWFCEEVAPLLPDTFKILIAGSKPVQRLRDVIDRLHNVELMENPHDVSLVYESCAVLMNPVQVGSGVNMKSIEMLKTDLPIVCSPQGVSGLPDEIAQFFRVASTADHFAEEIISQRAAPIVDVSARRAIVDEYFGDASVARFLSSLKKVSS